MVQCGGSGKYPNCPGCHHATPHEPERVSQYLGDWTCRSWETCVVDEDKERRVRCVKVKAQP
jgi:hypothetical protein